MALSLSSQCFFGSLSRTFKPIASATTQLKTAYGQRHDATTERQALGERINGIEEQLLRLAPPRLPSLLAAAVLLEADIDKRMLLVAKRLRDRGCILPAMPEAPTTLTSKVTDVPTSAVRVQSTEEPEEDIDIGTRTPPTPELRGVVPLRVSPALSPIAAAPGPPPARRVLALADEPAAPCALSVSASSSLPLSCVLSPILPHTSSISIPAPVSAPIAVQSVPPAERSITAPPPPAVHSAPNSAPISATLPVAPVTAPVQPAPSFVSATSAPLLSSSRTLLPVDETELASVPAYLRAQFSLSQVNNLRAQLALEIGAQGFVREASAVTILGGGARAKALLLLLIKIGVDERVSQLTFSRCMEPKEGGTGAGGEGWYEGGARYWANVEATLNGVLGGFARLSEPDINGSRRFLSTFLSGKGSRTVSNTRALDCGAGIGRISKHLLVKEFARVDLVEQNPKFIEAARKLLADSAAAGEFYTEGLQTFIPKPGTYDVIWVQWVLGHLTDADLVAFFKRCKVGLRPGGLIIVKENVTGPEAVIDKDDNSVTRTESQLRQAFADAGVRVLRTSTQTGFPSNIFPVLMFALE